MAEIIILTPRLAKDTRAICEQLYAESNIKVYDYCNKIGLRYDECIPCGASTPTISDPKNHTCALCGTNKSI